MKDEALLQVFSRALRCKLEKSNFSVKDIAAWDSLTHIKLVMELEREFLITISPDEIPGLYSDFETVLRFVEDKV